MEKQEVQTPRKRSNVLGIIATAIGGFAVLFVPQLALGPLVCGILAIVFGKKDKSKVGLILGIIGTSLAGVSILLLM